MNWEQKLAAIQAFAGSQFVNLKMRKPGDWYVDAAMEIGGNSVLVGSYGNGGTPEAAVNDHWRIYAEDMPRDRYAVADRHKPQRRGRWNGYMWELMTEEEVKSWHDRRSGVDA